MGFPIRKEKRRVLQDIRVGLSPLLSIHPTPTACDSRKFRMYLFLQLAVCSGPCPQLEMEKTIGWERK
jgi:hypothetical protein